MSKHEGGFDIFIASSWKSKEYVRRLAEAVREMGYSAYDFTDPDCRENPEIPSDKFPEDFDPMKETYWSYLNKFPEWGLAVEEDKGNIDKCKMLVLILPCGKDATADWAYAKGRGIPNVIIGNDREGERTPSYLWADRWFANSKAFLEWLKWNGFALSYKHQIKLGDMVLLPDKKKTAGVVVEDKIVCGGNCRVISVFPFVNPLKRFWMLRTEQLDFADEDINKLQKVT